MIFVISVLFYFVVNFCHSHILTMHKALFFCSFLLAASYLTAQPNQPFFQIDDRKLIGVKWKYTYALHVKSNTIVHQAETGYDYFIHFRYDYSYEQYLNGNFSRGTWSINGDALFYAFKNIRKFTVATINNTSLVLEFAQPNTNNDVYQYHFVAVEAKDAPFVRQPNELPEVVVKGKRNREAKRPWWVSLKKQSEKQPQTAKNEQYISVELVGGGYYGGIDPVMRDIIYIKNDGRIIKEYQSKIHPLTVTRTNISRKELEEFAEYILQQKYFGFERVYDCDSPMCHKRKTYKPTPIPLRLAVTYGTRRKVVTVMIWGPDDYHERYINYPPAMDNIIDAIQRMASRPPTRS